MDDDSTNEAVLFQEIVLSPLKVLAIEAHEMFLELQDVGFPENVLSQIMANILSDAVFYRVGLEPDDEDEDADDDEDELEDGIPE